jgi:aspartate racemase
VRTIGLLGGMSWESSAEYYRLINESVRRRLGGHHSARSLMLSVDFAEIEEFQRDDRWDDAARTLLEAASRLERGGADFIVLCTNTMHRVADRLEAEIGIPLLHIADPTGDEIRAHGISVVGLVGTRYTMEQGFYRERLRNRHGLDLLVPGESDRELVHRVIYEELVLGRVEDGSRRAYQEVVTGLVEAGAGGVILGCTEIGLLIGQEDSPVPIFDTTRIHAERAVDFALEPSSEDR